MYKDIINNKYKNNDGESFTVVSQSGCTCGILFDNCSHVQYKHYDFVITGAVKNYFKPTVYGVGYLGFTSFKSMPVRDKEFKYIYECWKGMLRRCYSDECKWTNNRIFGIKVTNKWHSFRNFYLWCKSSVSNFKIGLELDKDILGNGKEYSDVCCIFVPKSLNNFYSIVNPLKQLPSGVRKDHHKFQANVSINKSKYFLGSFDTEDEASDVYHAAKTIIGNKLLEECYDNGDIPLWLYERCKIVGWRDKWVDRRPIEDVKIRIRKPLEEMIKEYRSLQIIYNVVNEEPSETIRTGN